ncbi:MAG: RES domain-containing protein [Xanthobacteraceae bacterium]
MRAQKLDRTLMCYRIGDPDGVYPIFDATASRLYPGRWNTPASPMIYASEHYSTAMLEKLVHGSGQLPPNQHFIRITVPHGAAYEILNTAALPDWYVEAGTVSKGYGEAWQRGKRSLILIVPSVVARIESNILINPEHPEFPKIETSLHQPVWWDKRLFAR